MHIDRFLVVLLAAAATACFQGERDDGVEGTEIVPWPGADAPEPADPPVDESPIDDGDEDEDEGEESCSPAPEALAYSLCSCEGFAGAGEITVRGGLDPAFVGVNEETAIAGRTEIEGSAIFYGGLSVVSTLDVTDHLATAQSLTVVGDANVGGNVDVGDSLTGVGSLRVDEALRVAGSELMFGDLSVDSRGDYQPPPVPCGCDDPIVDVVADVTAAREHNHNEVIGLPRTIAGLGDHTYTLPGGRYYLEGAATLGTATFVIDGPVSLYIEGSMDLIGSSEFKLTDDGSLDLYVAGDLRAVGNFQIGDIDRAGDVRIFIGGKDSVALAPGNQAFYGSIYAPESYLVTAGSIHVVGAVLVRGFTGAGRVLVEYVAPNDFPDEECPPSFDDCIADPDLGGCDDWDHIPEG